MKTRKVFNKVILVLVFVSIHYSSYSQSGNWDAYIAEWKEGPGSVTLNMDLINSSPKKNLPYLVITGVKYSNCRNDGFPEKEAFDILYEISDSVNNTIARLTKSEHAGTFTFQCERMNYIYVSDTIRLRSRLESLYKRRFSTYKYSIVIEADEQWKAYREFLYPNEAILEYMSNQNVLENLIAAGDDLSEPRQVEHWIYFNNPKDREQFAKIVKKKKFKIEGMQVIENSQMPFQLHISRKDNVDPPSINKLTSELRASAKRFNGNYDGWETIVVK